MSTPASADVSPARPPARWLVAVLVAMLVVLGVLANHWGFAELAAGAPSLISGQPGFSVAYLDDPSGTLDFPAAREHAADFRPLPDTKYAVHPRHVWYRVRIDNPTDRSRRSIFALANDFIMSAQSYQLLPDGTVRRERSGSDTLWSERAVQAAKVAFSAEVPARAAAEVFVHVNDPIKQPNRFFLWPYAATFGHIAHLYVIEYVGYVSLWLALLVYNGFLYAVLQRRDYALYLCYILGVGAIIFLFSDICSFVIRWPLWGLRGMLVIATLNATTFCLVRFSRILLETGTRAPRIDVWLSRLSWTVLVSSVAVPAFLWQDAAWPFEAYDVGLNILVFATLPIVGFLLLRRRSPLASLYLVAFVPLVVTAIYGMESNLGMPGVRNNALPALCAQALELIVLALALAWRYRLLSDDANRIRLEYTARLEQEVLRQTQDLRRTNESLVRANRDKDRVFSILGHDLRGPAQTLFSLCRFLAEDPNAFSPAESAALAKEIEEACQTQIELLDTLLTWGRTQSGGGAVKAEALPPGEIVTSAVGALAPAARRKSISLTTEIEPDLTVYADARAAEAIVRNLVGNALKFTRPGGSVTVAARRVGDWVEVTVRDTGVGIAPQRLGQLFSGPVDSVHGTKSEKGSGIGLILCRDLAQASGGDLRLESEEGRGTTATLVLSPNPAGPSVLAPS